MAIAFNAAADLGNNGGSSNPFSVSYTCGSGSNRLLIVGLLGDLQSGNDDITGVTYNSVAMTLAAKNTSETQNRFMYIYYLLNQASGANNVVISSTFSHYLIAVAADYTGVLAKDGSTTNQDNTIGATSLTTSLTTSADNCWTILLEMSFNGGSGSTAGTGSTQRVLGAAFGEPALYDSNGVIHPAGSYSMTTNVSGGSLGIGHVMVSFSPTAGSSFGGFTRQNLAQSGSPARAAQQWHKRGSIYVPKPDHWDIRKAA